jgi:GNAT superfamily N-acetyltransferase
MVTWVSLSPAPGELFVVRLALLLEWQGRGIGTAIVRMLVDRARELESDELERLVELDGARVDLEHVQHHRRLLSSESPFA